MGALAMSAEGGLVATWWTSVACYGPWAWKRRCRRKNERMLRTFFV